MAAFLLRQDRTADTYRVLVSDSDVVDDKGYLVPVVYEWPNLPDDRLPETGTDDGTTRRLTREEYEAMQVREVIARYAPAPKPEATLDDPTTPAVLIDTPIEIDRQEAG